MGKNQNPDTRIGSGMDNPDHISESLKIIFWVETLKIFYADPGSEMEKKKKLGSGKKFGSRIRDKHPGSATLGRRQEAPKRHNVL
jgi:hypothetical protein